MTLPDSALRFTSIHRRVFNILFLICTGGSALLGPTLAAVADGTGAAQTSVRIVLAPKDCFVPDVVLDAKGVLHMVYALNRLAYYVRSTDNGITFSAPVQVNSRGNCGVQDGRAGTETRGRQRWVIHVVWVDCRAPGVATFVRYARQSRWREVVRAAPDRVFDERSRRRHDDRRWDGPRVRVLACRSSTADRHSPGDVAAPSSVERRRRYVRSGRARPDHKSQRTGLFDVYDACADRLSTAASIWCSARRSGTSAISTC